MHIPSSFWVILCDTSVVREAKYPTKAEARGEARLLAERNPGQQYIVLESVVAYQGRVTVDVERCDAQRI